MRIFDINPPPSLPVTLDTAKAFLRVDNDDEDGVINSLISAAQQQIENRLGQSLITRAQRMTRLIPSGRVLYLSRYPVAEITGVRVIPEGEPLPVTRTAYATNLKARPVAITLTTGQNWLVAFPDGQGVEVDFSAGYGASPDDIPMPIRQALLLLIAHSHQHRGDTDAPLPFMVDALLMPYQGLRL